VLAGVEQHLGQTRLAAQGAANHRSLDELRSCTDH